MSVGRRFVLLFITALGNRALHQTQADVFGNNLTSTLVFPGDMTDAGTGHMLRPEGMGWRIGVSIFSFFAAIIAAILWLFFYAGSYNAYQNLAIIVVIFLAFVAVMGAVWASWGMRQRNWWNG